MTEQQIVDLLIETGVILNGHFLLSSGRHSARYLQCAQVLQYPHHAERLARCLKNKLQEVVPGLEVDAVVGPALGGVIVSYELARQFGVRSLFTERHDGKMTLRRGFTVTPGQRIVVVEDVVTTGGSLLETVEVVRGCGAMVVAAGSIIDRCPAGVEFDLPYVGLIKMDIQTYAPEECPLCRQGSVAYKPGSRNN